MAMGVIEFPDPESAAREETAAAPAPPQYKSSEQDKPVLEVPTWKGQRVVRTERPRSANAL
jgi:hypothetical protein